MAASSAAKQGDNRFDAILYNERYQFSDFQSKGRQAFERIIEVLNQEPDLSIARYILGGGGVGKRTTPGAVFKPDFDAYVFFNLSDKSNAGIQATIPTLLDQIAEALSRSGYAAMKITEFAVQVQLNEQGTPIYFDVYPGVNFSRGDIQWFEVIRRNVAANSNLPYLDSSKAEKTAEFLEEQKECTHDVVKLAKIWDQKCVKNTNYMAGRSTIVELVAVKAALDEEEAKEGKGDQTMTSALVRFFNYMKTDWRNLRILFGGVWRPKDAHDKFFSRLLEVGILIDPIDPYRNYLDDETVRSGWSYFQSAANSSLQAWHQVQRSYNCDADKMIGM